MQLTLPQAESRTGSVQTALFLQIMICVQRRVVTVQNDAWHGRRFDDAKSGIVFSLNDFDIKPGFTREQKGQIFRLTSKGCKLMLT